MLTTVRVLACVCVSWAAAQRQQLGYYEGDICKQDGGSLWNCTKPVECLHMREDIVNGYRPEICSFQGRVPIICCKPKDKLPELGSKSQQMCKKYAEAVYLTVTDGWTGLPEKIDTCGTVEPLITNGKKTEPREFPHMAMIGYDRKGFKDISWLCGGSLISERFVLSAAHCTTPPSRKIGPAKWVRLGEYNRNSVKDEEAGLSRPKDLEIIERINYPEYNPALTKGDIALYRLGEDVRFSEYMRPACLQTMHQFPKTYAIATGWGVTENRTSSDVLMKVNLTLVSRKECSERYETSIGPKGNIQDESQICAGGFKDGRDTCSGDSGGPLQLLLREPYCMYSIIGITSFGPTNCGNSSWPGVYTRVSNFIPWIESIVWP